MKLFKIGLSLYLTLLVILTVNLQAYPCKVGLGASTPYARTETERQQLINTLQELGLPYGTYTSVSAAYNDGVKVWVDFCGVAYWSDSSGIENYVSNGTMGYVQVSDWGRDIISNSWRSVPENSSQTVTINNNSHPITQGVPSSWTTRGFWQYGWPYEDFIGWGYSGDNLASISGYSRGLAATTYGNGRVVYIGWNAYGSTATAYDKQILFNAILWVAGDLCPTPTPTITPTPTVTPTPTLSPTPTLTPTPPPLPTLNYTGLFILISIFGLALFLFNRK